MKAKRFLVLVLIVGVTLGIGGETGLGQGPEPQVRVAPQASLGTAFTYQGRLIDGGSAANGSYDFQFGLYDVAEGGSPQASITKYDVPVSSGLFVVELDFGDAYDGTALWLEVAVAPTGSGAYTTLSRQALTAAPYALHAQQVPWSGVTGKPSLIGTITAVTAGTGLSGGGTSGAVTLDVEFPLVATGSFGPDSAPLVMSNSHPYGAGLRVESAARDGLFVNEAGISGLYVGEARYGVFVNSASEEAGYSNGDVAVTGSLSKGGGGFKIDHPVDPENKTLSHSFVESPDMMNVCNGNVVLNPEGEAWVELPEWFEALNRDFRYQLTPIGAPGPNLYIAERIRDNRFRIAGGMPDMEVSWQVTGIRQDAWAQANRVPVEEQKPPEEQGTYLHPKAYGLPETMGLAYKEAQEHESRRAALER